MFTLNIRNIVRATKGGIKWAANASLSPEVAKKSLQSQIVDIGKNSKDGLDFITKRKDLLNSASEDELKKLKELAIAKKAGKTPEYNEILRQDIQNTLDAKAAAKAKATDVTATALQTNVPAIAPAVVAAKETRREGTEAVIAETRVAVSEQMAKVERVIAHTEQESLDLQYETNGDLKASSIVGLLSDLDGISGIERTNRGWFRRTFFGGGDQKEVVGEQQLKQLLQGKNQAQLNEIYTRITGDTTGISISEKNKKNFRDGENPQNNRYDFEHATQSKITKFQTELIQQVDVVATMSSILLDDKDARTGLRAVLEGKTEALQAALSDPKRIEKFKETLKANGTLDRDPAFLEKVASVLLRIGISAGFSVFSGGIMGGYIEQGKLDVKNGKTTRDGLNLTAKTGVGKEGSASAAASIDLAGIRLEGNWNDPEMRISNRVAYVMEADDKMKASRDLMTKMNEQYGGGAQPEKKEKLSDKEQAKLDKITDLGNAYIQSQELLNKLPDSPAKTDALAKNTLTYLSKVEAIQGTRLKGIFASATLSGWMVGLSGAAVDTSASFDKIKVGAATIEGEVLGKESLTQEQVKEYLTKLGITEENGKYMENGKEILTVPAGKKVQWNIEEIITDRDTIIRATSTLIDAKTQPKSELIKLRRTNVEAKNEYIDSNPKAVADLAKKLRLSNGKMTELETAISKEGYDVATTKLENILKTSKDKTAIGLLEALKKLTTPESKKAFFDLFLGKTSGSVESRKMGSDLEQGKDVKSELTKYYDRLAKPFAKQYGIEEAQVKAILEAIKPTLDKAHIATLGNYFKEGFTGLVAFNQKNAGKDFVTVDKIDHANARFVGNPSEVTDTKMADKIRGQVKTKISDKEAQEFQTNNPALKDLKIDDIKTKMVAGKVSAYLSFEESAQCFNLGFVAEPGDITQTTGETDVPVDSRKSRGTLVGASESEVGSVGLGLGQRWTEKKPEDPNNPNNPNDPKTQPGDGGEVVRPVTPQPIVTPTPVNPGVTPPSVNPGTVDVF
ncbi:hypothetical protein HOO68_03060 [Candidatus Gracilibacteria bacterium]|nr:hypothetical protein [Candidatus Gracilibacteria bacterium]